jgi:histidine triad (HIT) family protein
VATNGPDAFDPDCPFCEIVTRVDDDAREVYRDEHVVAFFPTEPATLGHTLVVPRAHIPDIWSLDAPTATHLARATVLLAGAIKRTMQPAGLNVIQSNGEAATQTVRHLHVHLVPRQVDDKIGRIWPVETHYSETQKDETWARLRAECRHLNSTPPERAGEND